MASSPEYSSRSSTSTWSTVLNRSSTRGLGSHPTSPLGVFSPAKNHAILCVGMACASFSLLAALISLRWFLLMRRSYRHHLILFLIMSDTWKSLWYFVSPLVVFTRGQIQSSSNFCQASGFFLSVGLEASDFAILMIALHTILYVFQRPQIKGEGGLYPYRKFIYPLWLGLPVLSASLAFTNPQGAYVTSGTFCYLPKRPFWYRLALSWIPRYLIFITIFSMYAALFLYVHMKFRDFKLENPRDASGSNCSSIPDNGQSRPVSKIFDFGSTSNTLRGDPRKESANSNLDPLLTAAEPPLWENVSFITSKPLQDAGVAEEDFAPDAGSSKETSVPNRHLSVHSTDQDLISQPRKESEVPTLGTNFTGESAATESSAVVTPHSETTNHVKSARSAIRWQLRLLFIYPLVYLLMWTFPFASHCLLYSDYYTAHPPFWLSVLTTASLSLQAGVDCLVFSWRERPWNWIESSPGIWSSTSRLLGGKQEREQPSPSALEGQEPSKRDSNWWEAEGRKRNDSVWLGTDEMNRVISRQEREEQEEEEEKKTG